MTGNVRKNFILLLQGQFVSNLGSQIYDMAMLLWLKEISGSPAVMGLAMLLSNLPETLLAPAGGKLADRKGAVRVMVAADLASGLAVGIVVVAILLGPPPVVLIAALCLSNGILGLSAACFTPAASALVPALISAGGLEKANAAQRFSGVGARVLGQGVGGLLYGAAGAVGAFALNALSFFISALTETFIRPPVSRNPPATPPARLPLWRDTVRMVSTVWRDRALRVLLLYIASFHLCLSCLPVSLPFYVENALGLADAWFGVYMAAYTVGIMGGFVVAGTLKRPAGRFARIAAAGSIVGLLFGLLAASLNAWLSWIVLAGIGTGIGFIVVNLMTELQLNAEPAEMGGIMGAAHAVGGASLPLGMAATGLILSALNALSVPHAVSVRLLMAAAGSAAMGLGVMAWQFRPAAK